MNVKIALSGRSRALTSRPMLSQTGPWNMKHQLSGREGTRVGVGCRTMPAR